MCPSLNSDPRTLGPVIRVGAFPLAAPLPLAVSSHALGTGPAPPWPVCVVVGSPRAGRELHWGDVLFVAGGHALALGCHLWCSGRRVMGGQVPLWPVWGLQVWGPEAYRPRAGPSGVCVRPCHLDTCQPQPCFWLPSRLRAPPGLSSHWLWGRRGSVPGGRGGGRGEDAPLGLTPGGTPAQGEEPSSWARPGAAPAPGAAGLLHTPPRRV